MSESLSRLERALVRIDEAPLGPVLRIAIGFGATTLWLALPTQLQSGWFAVSYFIGALFAIRAVPLVVRRLIQFSPEIRAVWTHRRNTAKRFDSYQWQKVFWFATGMWLKMRTAGASSQALQLLVYVGLIAGALGLSFWFNRRRNGAPLRATDRVPNRNAVQTIVRG